MNIHKYLWYKIIRNSGTAFGGAPMGKPPSAAAALGLCLWLFYIINMYGYSLYIPYIFHIYFLAMWSMFSLVCVLNLWSQEKTSPYRKTTFLFLFFRLYTFYIFISNFMIFIKVWILNHVYSMFPRMHVYSCTSFPHDATWSAKYIQISIHSENKSLTTKLRVCFSFCF